MRWIEDVFRTGADQELGHLGGHYGKGADANHHCESAGDPSDGRDGIRRCAAARSSGSAGQTSIWTRWTIRVVESLHAVRDSEGPQLVFMNTKTEASERTFSIAESLARRLQRWKVEQTERRLLVGSGWRDFDLVCDRGDGAPLHPDSMSTAFRRVCAKAEMPAGMRLHDLRHGAATILLREGVDVKIVSNLLGHSSSSFTRDAYMHVLAGMTEGAADALDQALGGS